MPQDRQPYPTVDEVALGAFLHDIGKLLQRAHAGNRHLPDDVRGRESDVLPVYQGRYGYWHALWTDAFFDWIEREGLRWPDAIDPRWVRDIAVYHHKPLADTDQLALGVTGLATTGDRVSSGLERRPLAGEDDTDSETDRRAFRRTALHAIVARLDLGTHRAQDLWHMPSPLDPETLMPIPKPDGAEVEAAYGRLWTQMQQGWKRLVHRAGNDVEAFHDGVLALSESLLWAVPSSTVDQPDVGLHDHARATAAIAACLHRLHGNQSITETTFANDDTPRLRLLVGDLSGIQSTLFRLASEQITGLNRILRGRSQRFALIADAAIRRCLEAFGLPVYCALQTAGGRFLILAPALPDGQAEAIVDSLRAEFDDWMLEQYCGDLSIGLDLGDPFGLNAFRRDDPAMTGARSHEAWQAGLQEIMQNQTMTAERAKLHSLRRGVTTGVVRLEFDPDLGICPACGVRPARRDCVSDSGVYRCRACHEEHEIGRRLPRARFFAMGPDRDGSGILSRTYQPRRDSDLNRPMASGWRLEPDDPEADGIDGLPAARRFGQVHVPVFGEDARERYASLPDPVEPGDIKTTDAMALDSQEVDPDTGQRRGRPMLAALKADVDRLGQLFSTGLGTDISLARRSALSRMIDAYFSGRLGHLIRTGGFDLYTVYAGGDDLFLIGPWQQVFSFAHRLQTDFRDFSGANPDVTLSAGLALFDPHTPVSIAADQAEHRLEQAKQAGRNKISAIEDTPLDWDAYAQALKDADALNTWIRENILPSGFLYRLMAFNEAERRIQNEQGTDHDLGWKARYSYLRARMEKSLADKGGNTGRLAEIDALLTRLLGLGTDPAPGTLRLVFYHALYRNR